MGIEDFKRWHWIAIGLVVGAVLAYTRMQFAPGDTGGVRRTISAVDFAQNLGRKTSKGEMWMTDVVIYPPFENKTLVTCMMVPPDAVGVVHRQSYQFYADTPFRITRAAPPKPDFSVLDYVKSAVERNATIKYSYAWWTLPLAIILIWGGGAAILIGGVWPVMLNLMIGAGFGRAKEAESEYDLDRFKGGPEPAIAATNKGATGKDRQQVQEFADSLERDLAAKASSEPATELIPKAGSEPVRKLDGGPLETATVASNPQDPKDYKGEFYPVVRPHGHEDEKKH